MSNILHGFLYYDVDVFDEDKTISRAWWPTKNSVEVRDVEPAMQPTTPACKPSTISGQPETEPTK